MNNHYVNFAASKMSNNPKFEVIALKRANEFLKMFKTESVKINQILSEYPVKMGKFPKKFHKEIKSELAVAGFGSVSNFLIK
jgi:predicted TIM-barrel enzyme